MRYKGTKTCVITSDYSEASKFGDTWLAPRQGTDAALAMAFGHVILKEFHVDNPSAYFTDYVKRTTDMPMLVMLDKIDGNDFGRGSAATAAGVAGEPQGGGEHQGKITYSQGRFLRAADLVNNLGEDNNPDWKTIAINNDGRLTSPNGAIGYRWGEKGKWNLEAERPQRRRWIWMLVPERSRMMVLPKWRSRILVVRRTNIQYFQHT